MLNSISSPSLNHRAIALAVLAGVGYVLLFHAGKLLVGENLGAYPIWLSDGFALGFWFATRGHCRWPQVAAVLLANFTISFDSAAPLLVDWPGGIINAFQLVFAAWLVSLLRTRLGAGWVGIRRLIGSVVAIVGVANGVCALALAWAFQATGRGGFEENFIALFISDGLGILIVTPLIVSWNRNSQRRDLWMAPWRTVEMVAILLTIAVVAHAIFSQWPDAFGLVAPQFYLIIPFVLWAAVRFQLRGATLAVAECALIAIYFTMHYQGPFVSGFVPTKHAILELQGFLAVLSVSTLFASALLEERRAAIQNAVAWQRRYDAAITASENLIYEIELPGGNVNWAGDVRRVLGWTSADLDTVAKWTSHVHPDDLGKLAAIRERLATGSLDTFKTEYRFMRPDGVPLLVGVSAYYNTNPPLRAGERQTRQNIIGFVKDITELERFKAERLRLEAERRQAQKMESIGRLAGGIAHDFNNILASILGYGEMARNRASAMPTPDAALLRQLDTIVKAGERGRNLIAQILTFSRKNPALAQSLNAHEMLDETVSLLKGSFAHEIIYRTDPASETVNVHGNATELHQLFMNLAVNGLQAMPDLGTLEIIVDRVTLTVPLTVSQNQLVAGAYLRVAIRDQGVGIDAATRAHMFEPFFTTKAAGRGTGLGLSLAMSVAKAHGGGIDVDSAPGAGATFTVYLPLYDSTANTLDVAIHLPRGHNECVLLVDDEPALRDLAEEILAGLGYQSASFGDSAEALAAFERDPDRFDAILTDEVMPGLTGTQMAGRIHALRPDTPIIIITGFGGPGFELRAQQAGVSTVLRKPYHLHDLAHALAGVIGQRARKR